MHEYCRRSLAPLLKQRQTISTNPQTLQPDRVQQPSRPQAVTLKSQCHGEFQLAVAAADSQVSQPPMVLPSVSLPEADESDDGDTIVYDVPKYMTIERPRVTAVAAQPAPANPRPYSYAERLDQNIYSQSRCPQQAAPVMTNTITDTIPLRYTGRKQSSQDDELQDCEKLAIRVAEWLYDDKESDPRAPTEDPYDDQVLDFLSPELDKEALLSVPPSPRLTRTPTISAQSQPIVQMIPNSPIQPYAPYSEMRYEVAHRALAQAGAGIAVRYRIPTAGYVPPATRPQPLPLPVVPGPPSNNITCSSKTWDDIRVEITKLPPVFGFSGPA